MSHSKVVTLQTPVKNNLWGKIGSDSLAAVIRNEQPDFKIDNKQHYAEMWMGAHVRAPAKLLQQTDDVFLDAWIQKNPVDILGKAVYEKYGANLPFLFKILSIRTALSIQAHPGKVLAEKLHLQRPDIYADPNHKPEMAIALTEFEGLCGFRPITETLCFLERLPELQAVVGEDIMKELKQACGTNDESSSSEAISKVLKRFMNSLLRCDSSIVAKQLSVLEDRINNLREKNEDISLYLGELFLRLHEQYPGDIGCFCIYVLNFVRLQPSEAIFFEADFPHAYISGDLIECMACSDNVVRVGFTPKLKDVDTLIEMLKYEPRKVSETKLQPVKENDYTWLYNAPIEEFAVRKIQIPAGSVDNYSFKIVKGPSIILTLNGKANLRHSSICLKKGVVLFVCCDEELVVENITEDLLVFQAFCEVDV